VACFVKIGKRVTVSGVFASYIYKTRRIASARCGIEGKKRKKKKEREEREKKREKKRRREIGRKRKKEKEKREEEKREDEKRRKKNVQMRYIIGYCN
jgi:hypothetical protein